MTFSLKNFHDSLTSENESKIDPTRITLSERSFDRVYYDIWKGQDSLTGQDVFIKRVLRRKPWQKLAEERRQFTKELFLHEISKLLDLDQKNIAPLVGYYDTLIHHVMVLQIADTEDLIDRIIRLQYLTEMNIGSVSVQLLNAVAYLQKLGRIHGDLRINNIFYAHSSSDANVIITDFGLTRALEENCRFYGIVDAYAPETIERRDNLKFSCEVDIWSIGSIVYTLLCGYPPFSSHSRDCRQAKKRIQYGTYCFHCPVWDIISNGAKHFISNALKVVGLERIKVNDALAYHKWIKGETASDFNIYTEMEKHLKITSRKLKAKC